MLQSLVTRSLLLLSIFTLNSSVSAEKSVSSEGAILKEVVVPEAADELLKKVQDGGKKFEFQSDVTRLLKIFADHMYVSDEAFLRELIANSCDAIRKSRQAKLKASMDGGASDDGDDDYKVVIRADKEQGIITVTDNGIGMTHDDLKEFLGTIAKSGTSKFNLENPNKNADVSNFIGQFGVGFYSVLLVADQVMVISKNDADKKQWVWQTDASASFNLAEDPRGNTLKRGTQIVLKLKPKAAKFLDDGELETVLQKYFEYDANAIYLVKHTEEEVPISSDEGEKKTEEPEKKADVEIDETEELKEKEEEKTPKTKKVPVEKVQLISQHQKPVWKRDPAQVKPEEYVEFYKVLSKDRTEPLTHIHVKAEGDLDFRSILYIPKRPPFNAFSAAKNSDSFIKLHVRGVFVTAKLDDFLPKYLSFVRGIIDSDDLPLNISRDMLQSNVELRSVQKKVVSKIFEMIENLSKDEEKYKEFFSAYGSHLKLEIIENERYRSKIAKLLRYESSSSDGKLVSLKDYIERAEANEKHKAKKTIYFLAGTSKAEIERSPFLEKLKSANMEVIYLTDTVDEHTIQSLREFDDWKFQSIAKDGLDLGDEDEATKKATEEEFKPLTEVMAKYLTADVEKVVISSRLTDAPCAVVANQFGWTGSMERVIMSQTNNKDDPMVSFFSMQKKIFEINPKNPLIKGMLEKVKAAGDKPDAALKTTIKALYDSTLVWSGYSVKNSKSFAKNIDRLARKVLGIEDAPEEPEVEEKEPNPFGDLGNLGDLGNMEMKTSGSEPEDDVFNMDAAKKDEPITEKADL